MHNSLTNVPTSISNDHDPSSTPVAAWQTAVAVTIVVLSFAISVRGAVEPGRIIEINSSRKLTESDLQGRLVITASNIVIDGGGLTLVGRDGNPKDFTEVAVMAKGVSNVTLRNFNARGWETGLKIIDGEGWLIENCNFSGNFHDPEFGWGENGRRGGIVLERVRKSTLRKNKANNVWDACVLLDSNDNTLELNDFSHTSNTCLKLWHASKNMIRKNNLSYGIRINPGEVHARDSTSVLIESGSDNNTLAENDCTHGGDGIFVRVLNGWCSVGNRFERNDCSYANNNGVECWAPDNVFIGNKANHCSYGFWLGGSDHSRLEENEASFNGLPGGFHNSPHLPGNGHAGIVFMFGPSSHTVARRNKCIGNNGAGIAVIGDLNSKGAKWKAYHWIIEGNLLAKNRWGIFLQYADWIRIAGNQFDEERAEGNSNSVAAVQSDQTVTRLTKIEKPLSDVRAVGPREIASATSLDGPTSVRVGQQAHFALKSLLPKPDQFVYEWDLGDGTTADSSAVSHTFAKPGFYRIGLTVSNSAGSELAWRDLYVVDDVQEIGTEGTADKWEIEDFHDRVRSNEQTSRAAFVDETDEHLVGKSALRVLIQPYAGFRASLTYPKTMDASWDLSKKSKLVFWMRVINEDVTGWQGGPFVVLHGKDGQRYHIEPKQGLDLMRQMEHNEGRNGWRRMEIPLRGNDLWQGEGTLPTIAQAVSLQFDSWGAPTLRLWIDGMTFE